MGRLTEYTPGSKNDTARLVPWRAIRCEDRQVRSTVSLQPERDPKKHWCYVAADQTCCIRFGFPLLPPVGPNSARHDYAHKTNESQVRFHRGLITRTAARPAGQRARLYVRENRRGTITQINRTSHNQKRKRAMVFSLTWLTPGAARQPDRLLSRATRELRNQATQPLITAGQLRRTSARRLD